MNKQKMLYYIGNAHLDPVWLWNWQDGYSEVLATFRSALDRMYEHDDFKFTSACSAYYQWVEKTDPDMFEEIKARVKEGRWNIVGGMFIQPDCNIPSGESFARHTLISQRYFKEKFDITVKTGYNVDSFGHNASIPKILNAAGIDRYVFMRPCETEKALGFDLFNWESDDGSKLLTYRIPHYYNIHMPRLHLLDEIRGRVDADGIPRMAFYGVGNHGGGPTAELIDAMKKKNVHDAVFSSVDDYFDDLDKDLSLPTVSEELQHHARGCYSATSYVKAMNRRCEESLLAAERLCVMANKLVGYPYPKKKFNKAWKNLLFNQFHDILAGCSIESAYRDASYLFGETMSIAEQEIYFASIAIARRIDTGTPVKECIKAEKTWDRVWDHPTLGSPVVVFNPHPFPVKDTVRTAHITERMTDECGNDIPFQMVRSEQTNGMDDKYSVCFMAELEPFGYKVYRAFPPTDDGRNRPEKTFEPLKAAETMLDNGIIRVEFDKTTGEIAKITELSTGRVILSGGIGTILTNEEKCDTWAHDQKDLGEEVARFGDPEFSVIEKGALLVTLRVKTRTEGATLTRHYTLTKDNDELRVWCEAELDTPHKAMKLTFPAKDKIICDIPYGTVTRELMCGEEPFSKWFATGDICVANDCKYGYDTTTDTIRMTVLRGAIFADHFGNRDDRCRYMERGPRAFSYSIFPFKTKTDAHKRAALLNLPLRGIYETFHHGELPTAFSGFECNCDHAMFSAIKMSEDGDIAVIRAYETEGQSDNVMIKLMGKEIDLSLKANGISTVDENSAPLLITEFKKN
ncbi:MAG: alpha-mannosidase [Clostridia bacterium]|nr:alpha-mannosidase [Clostridia bacterium]